MNIGRLTLLGAVTLSFLLAAACAPTNPDDVQPPEIRYSYDECEACGMLIDEPRHAAASVTLDGTAHKFDDIGDMVRYHTEHPTEQVRVWFVHDYSTEAWLRAETAWFVISQDMHTPMGHGVVAFAAKDDAQSLALEIDVEVLSFDEARAALAAMDHSSH